MNRSPDTKTDRNYATRQNGGCASILWLRLPGNCVVSVGVSIWREHCSNRTDVAESVVKWRIMIKRGCNS
jgi:hypothetical protein